MNFPKKLQQKLIDRHHAQSLRKLGEQHQLIDFSSNDYLGFAKSEAIFDAAHQFLVARNTKVNGATGSRLLSGNSLLYEELEQFLSKFHRCESALIFNSGYDANLGFFSSVPQRGDIILYDELSHASIRDGIQLSNAKSYKFKHNNVIHLDEMLKRFWQNGSEVYVVTEAVFSMDGDSPDLISITEICKKYQAFLIVDEAHALGVSGENGFGLIQQLGLEKEIFARIVTFGKAIGCHGACVLGNERLKQYLVNFARSFIYTTGLSPHSLATIKIAYEALSSTVITKLYQNIQHFKSEAERLKLRFIESNSAIHCCIISENKEVLLVAEKLQNEGFNIKPILSPTVHEGEERLRFCVHSYNSHQQITSVLEKLSTFVP